MSGMVITEEQLKTAIEEFAEEQYAELPFEGPDPEFSENYQARKRQFIAMVRENGYSAGSGRRNHRVLKTVAAVFAILIISFAILMVANPNVYAAVRNWTINIYNKFVDYTFHHTDDDHAIIICDPAGLPEGFETTETYHSGYYTRKLYENAETGDYIRFEYRKPTQSQIDRIEKRGQKAEAVTAANGETMYFAEGSPNRLFWYDKYHNIAFYVESNMNKDNLMECFASVDYRLPLYEPEWLPEGYEEIYREDLFLDLFIVYEDKDSDSFIVFSYSDMAKEKLITIWKGVGSDSDDIEYEELQIGNFKVMYYSATEHDEGAEMIWIDETNHLVFTLEGNIQKDMAIRIVQGIRCIETEW